MSKVFHLSEAASLAFHSMALIAGSEVMLNASKIAEITNASKNHISKVLQMLVKNNFLISTRGPNGGFIMNRSSDNCNLLDIYELMEGKFEISTCGSHAKACNFGNCVYGGLPEKFSREFKTYLSEKKLSDFIEKNYKP